MKKKLIVILSILLLFGCVWAIEKINALQYDIDVISINPETIYADGLQQVEVTVRVTKNNKPAKDHEIRAMAFGGGRFIRPRLVTDDNGYVTFTYQVYRASKFIPAGEVKFEFHDLSNSTFIRVPAKSEYYITVLQP